MGFLKIGSFLLAVRVGLAAVSISLGALGMMSPALAQEPDLEINVPVVLPPSQAQVLILATIDFTDPAIIDIQDSDGQVIGQGTHVGQLRCNNKKCSRKTQLQLNDVTYEYKFKTIQAIDSEARRIVAAGTGTINSNGQRERFLFTAIFEDNDGTIRVTYVASRSDASFNVPASGGTMTFRQQ